ncbi:MAG: DHA2 family efflux MFS transporter permease subunit [Eubacteriales bacterium]|nr:DHA2 family efflux MFS transporter permease subunit [Eubacteriales bacterium]
MSKPTLRTNPAHSAAETNLSAAAEASSAAPHIPAHVILSVVAAGIMSFCGVVVETAMNITFPTLMKEFGIGTATVQWITSGYLLMLAIIMPTSSFLNRCFSLRKQFTAASVLFLLGTVLCGTAPGFALMLSGRLFQGIGTGIALPLMYNIVLTQVPPARRGTMMGIASLIPAAAPAVGPSLGGLIVESMGWRMIFASLIPVLIAAMLIGFFCIHNNPKNEDDAASGFDFSGWILLAISFTCLIIMLSNFGTNRFFSVKVLGLLILFFAALHLFVRHSLRMSDKTSSASPLIRLEIFRSRRFCCALTAFVLMQFICLGIGFLLPNYSQIVLGKNALAAGCILLPGCAFAAVFSPFAGQIYDRFGARLPLLTGAFCMLLSAVLFTGMFFRQPSVIAMTVIYVFFAFGQTNCVGNGMSNGMSSLPAELSADGNAVFNTMQQLFGALGTAVVSVNTAKYQAVQGLADGIQAGAKNSFIVMLVLGVILVVAMFGALPRRAENRA